MKGGHRHGLILVLMMALLIPTAVQASVVGRLTQVEGRVDLLKKGKLPALPVAVGQEIGPGDVLRTKSLSKAQIKFVDDTVLDIAPESRVAIEEYLYDAPQGKRRAVLRVFRGLVHTLVSRILQMEKPDFIMKTHTGILGVRGTDWYSALGPLHTDFYNHSGTTEVSNIYPEIAGKVRMKGPQFCRVAENLAPTVPLDLTPEDFLPLERRMSPRLQRGAGAGTGAAPGAGTAPTSTASGTGTPGTTSSPLAPASETLPSGAAPSSGVISTSFTPTGMMASTDTALQNPVTDTSSGIYVPPQPSPPPTPQPVTYNFSLSSSGYLAPTGSFSFGGYGNGQGSSLYPGYFSWSGSGTLSGTPLYGTYAYLMTGTVSGLPDQTLTGTLSGTASNPQGWSGSFSGPVSISPTGTMTFDFSNGSWSIGGQTYSGSGSGTLISQASAPTTYNFSQQGSGYFQNTPVSGSPYNATQTSGGWGQRTGDLPSAYSGYYTLSASGTRSSNTPLGSISATYDRTMTGNVTGYQGQALTGTYNANATDSLGGSSTFSGPVTILSDGRLHYSYNNFNWTNQSGQTVTGTGSGATTPGTYFTQTGISGSVIQYGSSNGQVQTVNNNYNVWGTRTGVFPGQFGATFTMTNTAPQPGYYPPLDYGAFTGQMAGVVSGPAGGTQTGVMTADITGDGGNLMRFAGPVTINPDGSLSYTFYGNNAEPDPGQPGIWRNQGTWTQTPQSIPSPSPYTFSQTFQGTVGIRATSSNTADLTGGGWGARTGVYDSAFTSYLEGSLSNTSFPSGMGNLALSGTLSGSVTGIVGGSILTGSATFTGTDALGDHFSLTGDVTIRPNGKLTFTYTGPVTLGGSTYQASITMNQDPGVPFTSQASGSYQLGGGVLLNTGQLTGTQTGLRTGTTQPIYASLALAAGLISPSTGTVSYSGTGVMDPWYGGQSTEGFMSLNATVNGTTLSNVAGVTYYPTENKFLSMFAGLGSAPSGTYVNGVLAATPQDSGKTTSSFAQTISGYYQQTSNSPYNQATITNSGTPTGTMFTGTIGSSSSYPIKVNNFNIVSTSEDGAFPPGTQTGPFSASMLGAGVGPSAGEHYGLFQAGVMSDETSAGYGGDYFMETGSPNLETSANLSGYNPSPYGYPASQSGTWYQTDPPLSGASAAATTARALTRPVGIPLGNRIQAAARLANAPGASMATAPGGAALPPSLSKPPVIPLGSRIQAAARLANSTRASTATAPGGAALRRWLRRPRGIPLGNRIQAGAQLANAPGASTATAPGGAALPPSLSKPPVIPLGNRIQAGAQLVKPPGAPGPTALTRPNLVPPLRGKPGVPPTVPAVIAPTASPALAPSIGSRAAPGGANPTAPLIRR